MDRIANTGAAASGAVPLVVFIVDRIDTINKFLQAGAYVVSMTVGIAATVYYIRKSRKHD
jgi:hypothetical protein